eukprot:IDg4911t1
MARAPLSGIACRIERMISRSSTQICVKLAQRSVCCCRASIIASILSFVLRNATCTHPFKSTSQFSPPSTYPSFLYLPFAPQPAFRTNCSSPPPMQTELERRALQRVSRFAHASSPDAASRSPSTSVQRSSCAAYARSPKINSQVAHRLVMPRSAPRIFGQQEAPARLAISVTDVIFENARTAKHRPVTFYFTTGSSVADCKLRSTM